MKRYLALAIISSAILLLPSCATYQVEDENVYPTASGDKALVYFYRENKFAGGAISYYIMEGERKIGALGSGTYFFKQFDPGTYTFWAKTESKDEVSLTLVAGKNYYIKGEVDMGFFAGRPDLTVVHEMEGKSELKSLKLATIAGQ